MPKNLKLIALVAFLFIHCNSPRSENRDPASPFPGLEQHLVLTQLATYRIKLREPSGLTINPEGTALWTVANNQRVFKLDLQGRILDRLAYKGKDLEGIVYDPSDSTFWVVEERRREVVHLDANGNVIFSQKLALGGEENKGLEESVQLDHTLAFRLLIHYTQQEQYHKLENSLLVQQSYVMAKKRLLM